MTTILTMRMTTEPEGNDHSLSSYWFDLPQHLIAQEPAKERSGSRCLFTRRSDSESTEGHFRDILDQLRGDEVLVYNNTRVIPARIPCQRSTGGRIEVFLLRPGDQADEWLAWLSPSRRIKPGEILQGPLVEISVVERCGSSWRIRLPKNTDLESVGEVPLPPYIRRDSESTTPLPDHIKELDRNRYQTVFANKPGAVAAPTAGLHFDKPLLDKLENLGVSRIPITLHVGPGTFKPIEAEEIKDHRVDPEWYSITAESRSALADAKSKGRPIIAVGTTSLRVLESLPHLEPGPDLQNETDLTILPGYKFRHVDGLLTNFHLPGSSLLVLVSCFHGLENTRALYKNAIEKEFRFYSYGDCMLIQPREVE
ncbi:MAG: tRNA preQ1(34) S-adenosylmethionine ribosyltransferase-isomerase QueA [Planctomycetia bacterium]|nr:tRNA preQ1(34) S-adenosylmethionine ribosyltransferase-isomerase QueA [Planctomycetia bacterium]NCG13925.1 tRNA preQ1(34) S-adenosylmethionine ribosyltransferase-isomerase QueA [Planctomycetia bacterium]